MDKHRKAERQEQTREQTTLTALEREMSVFVRRALRSIWTEEDDEGTLGRWTYALLVRLSDDGPLRVGEVARRFGIDKSTASRHLARFEEVGLVEAIADERDARSALLRVTPQGEQCLAKARLARMQPLRRVFASWPEQDRAELTRLLARLNVELDQLGGSREP
ncbi:MarR family winged helix-turn-helix transcriptional regulator [Vitiosangium sp. GDMCC 1.1324]|uniref:MarR family winged helix-turn-helix transcriptional regulator n=1 Tax=Vitiosangium sp. (strain GDMCC 1.1324) TaxID=2138576 RepID=UPI000D35C67E|nr:MarR family transcriptional regulator [Vitiosangium sp. GDMCC 1.1324]PTL77610.1 MarR family transcriptional regulator [Vitiosangium sp. GDMCC 1.1324]